MVLLLEFSIRGKFLIFFLFLHAREAILVVAEMPTAKILHLLATCCKSTSQVHQILAQMLLHNLRLDTTVAGRFIAACDSLNLLNSVAFPLYINSNTKPHTFICNNLLKAYSHSNVSGKSPIVHSHMHRNAIPVNHYTFPFVLKALSDLRRIDQGASVHAQVTKLGYTNDVYVGNSLLNLYAANGDMFLCGKVFDEMPLRDVVSWTVVVSGYKEAGRFDDALIAFERMRTEAAPNQVTAVNALAACAGLGALEMGVWIHNYFVKGNGWELDVILGTALIDMYGKCGCIEEGLQIFHKMHEKNLFTWNAVIKGLAVSKNGKEALKWFHKMEEEGIEPDEVTLIAVLSACVHSGFVHTGRRIFSSFVNGKYKFLPSVKHYACIVDLLARSKCLEEALEVISEMPFEPTVTIWGALLSSSRDQSNFEMSELAAWKLVELEPQNSAYYVVLSNLYAEMGRWNDAKKVRELMKDRGLKKDMGSSIVECDNQGYPLESVA